MGITDITRLKIDNIVLESVENFNPLNAELNPICHLLTLLGTHHILHVSSLRVNDLRSILNADNKTNI